MKKTMGLCSVCERGRLALGTGELEKGVFVEVFRCSECGAKEYDLEVAKKIEAFYQARARKRSLIKLVRVLAVTIPADIVSRHKFRPGEKILVEEKNEEVVLKPVPA